MEKKPRIIVSRPLVRLVAMVVGAAAAHLIAAIIGLLGLMAASSAESASWTVLGVLTGVIATEGRRLTRSQLFAAGCWGLYVPVQIGVWLHPCLHSSAWW